MPVELFGASVRGPAHIRDGLPNQDAWGHARVGDLRVVVVADGMGSRPRSSEGARAACRAVPEALRAWLRHPNAPEEILLALLHLLWRARVAPLAPEDAATTCLFAAVRGDGSGWVGQLGDGLILIREGGGLQALSARPDDDFTNHTTALGVTRRLSAWTLRRLEPGQRGLLLCTDGVADDLLPEKYCDLLDWLEQELAPLPASRRWRRLAAELRDWPTPNHTDDKTLAYLWSQT